MATQGTKRPHPTQLVPFLPTLPHTGPGAINSAGQGSRGGVALAL